MKRFCLYLLMGVLPFSSLLCAKKKNKKITKDVPPQEMVVPEQASRDGMYTGKDGFDAEKKRQDVVDLVEKGSAFLDNNSFIEFLRRINHTEDFNVGELYLFIYDTKGVCIAHGRDTRFLWKNLLEEKDAFGSFFVKKIIKQAEDGAGWVAYEWHSATKVVYVKPIKKDGKSYVLGCAYYPHTKEDAVVSLVRGAAATFYNYSEQGGSPEDAFSEFSFPGGKFVKGEFYIYVVDKSGIIRANGFDPSEIGINYWNEKDSQGNYYIRDMIQSLADRPASEGRWFDFEYYNAPERDYVERVVDKKGNSYFIACGYNPYADKERATELTQRAVKAIKERGLAPVANVINDISNQEFVYGRMTVFIYDTAGTVIANGERPSLVGKNMSDEKDESGGFFVKEIIQQTVKNKTALVNYLLKNALVSMYAEALVLDGKTYIVGASFFPLSKESAVIQLVKSGAYLLKNSVETTIFRKFTDYSGAFVLGDLTIFVYGLDGTCYADGFDVESIWRNKLQAKDAEGTLYVKTMISLGKKGPAKVRFKKNNAQMIAYVEPLQKGKKTFIIGSGYYL